MIQRGAQEKRLRGGSHCFSPQLLGCPSDTREGDLPGATEAAGVCSLPVSSLDHLQARGSGHEFKSVLSSKGPPLLLPLGHFLHLSSAAVSDGISEFPVSKKKAFLD